jgi:hypothetical protein
MSVQTSAGDEFWQRLLGVIRFEAYIGSANVGFMSIFGERKVKTVRRARPATSALRKRAMCF